MTKERNALRMALVITELRQAHAGHANTGPSTFSDAADLLEALAKPEQEPVANNWSVFNTGAEVWSNLSLAEAIEEMTPSRIERGWSAVCLINKDNLPSYTTSPKRKEWVKLEAEHMDEITHTAISIVDSMLLTETKLKELNK